jgi:hypothetical protein
VLVAGPGEGLAQGALQALREKSAATHRQFLALKRFFTPRSVFLHVGAGDCVLALQAAAYVERVYAIDPLEEVLRRRRLPVNLRAVYAGPGGFGVQGGTVDVAYSETLAAARLKEILRCLSPGGAYLFRPLRSQTARGLRETLLGAGFSSVRFPAFFAVSPRKELIAAIR